MIHRLNLGTKFTLLLALVFLAGVVLSWFALSQVLQGKAEREVVSKAQILLKTMNAVRQYTTDNINTHVKPLLGPRDEFIRETVPGYAARQVFDSFRKDAQYQDFRYKEATLNPTNPLNKADSFEAALVERFRREPALPEQTGFHEVEGTAVFFTARPIRVKSASCLECHSVPSAAPAGMIRRYGSDAGFGWRMDEVVGSQIVYVPAGAIFSAGQHSALVVSGIFLVIFALAAFAITIFFRRVVVRPLGGLTAATQALSRGSLAGAPGPALAALEVPHANGRQDEIGQLAERFDFMTREVYSREERLRQARADMARSEAHFRSLIENASDAVMVLDADLNVRYASPSLERVLGFAPEAVVGRSPLECVDALDADAMQRALAATAARPGVSPAVEFCCAGAGEPKYVEATLANMIDNPAVEGIVVNMRDVTERRHTESLTREKIRAEQASELKSRFLANMSHEIRTPMNGILGMTELLLGAGLAAGPRRFAETIRNSGEALLGIINDILDFSKIEAGKLEIECIAFDLHDVAEQVLELLSARALSKGIALTGRIHPDVPRWIEGDPGRLRQVLTNLVSNAVKFTEHGSVTLEIARSGDSVALRADLVFSVTDTGIGLEPGKVETLFQSFTQADSSTTRKYGGTGLGLAISKELVELMGGTIDVRSAPGAGSCFRFTLNAGLAGPVEAEAVAQPTGAGEAPARIHARVLLAEDHAVNEALALAMLEDFGCEVEVARTGREVLAAVERAHFDLILMDCQMPEIDGLDATRALRRAEAEARACGAADARMPIIALTANAMQGDRERCLAAGMDDYLAKPFKQEQLRRVLMSRLSQPTIEPCAVVPPALDPRALDSIRALQRPGAPDLLERIASLYLDEAPRLLQTMQGAIDAGDRAAFQRAIHKLKSSSANLGAHSLAEACKTVEAEVRAGGLGAPQRLGVITREYDRARAALSTQVALRRAAASEEMPL